MQNESLNKGFGACKMEATAKVVAPISWVEQEKVLAFAEQVLAAVHDFNRHAKDGEFVAIDFPDGTFRKDFAGVAGATARLVGTRFALRAVLNSDRMMQFRRRTVKSADQLISDFDPRDEGYCLVRTRKTEKYQPGVIRRKIRRAERKGKPTANLEIMLQQAEEMSVEDRRLKTGTKGEIAVFLGGKPMMFERRKVTAGSSSARVSTYGMSDPEAPVIFDKWIVDQPKPVRRKRPQFAVG